MGKTKITREKVSLIHEEGSHYFSSVYLMLSKNYRKIMCTTFQKYNL